MDYKELIYRLRYKMVCSDDIAEAATAIETLLAEREAVVAEMHGRCIKCKHFSVGILDYPCTDCRYEGGANDHWQWRGPTPPDRERTEG